MGARRGRDWSGGLQEPSALEMLAMTLRRPRRVPAGAMVKRAMDECPRMLKSDVGCLVQEARLSAHPRLPS